MRPRVLRNNFETGYLGCFFFSSPHSHSLMKLPQDTALLPRTVYRFCATEFFSAVSIFPNILIKRNWGPGRSNQLVANVRLKAHLLSQAQPLCIPMLPARALNPSLVGGGVERTQGLPSSLKHLGWVTINILLAPQNPNHFPGGSAMRKLPWTHFLQSCPHPLRWVQLCSWKITRIQ